jgi:hypothetical protein
MKERSGSQSDEQLTDEEMHRILARPEVRARLAEALAHMADRTPALVPDITTEEQLREFLREHG